MSGHDRAVELARGYAVPSALGHANVLACALLDAVAENQQLRDALDAFFAEYDSGAEYAHCAPTDATEALMRAALDGAV